MIRKLLLLLVVYLLGDWFGFHAGQRYERAAMGMTSRWVLYDWKNHNDYFD